VRRDRVVNTRAGWLDAWGFIARRGRIEANRTRQFRASGAVESVVS
jgi:hypothetical protein